MISVRMGSDAHFHARVTILCELPGEDLVQLSKKNSIRHKLPHGKTRDPKNPRPTDVALKRMANVSYKQGADAQQEEGGGTLRFLLIWVAIAGGEAAASSKLEVGRFERSQKEKKERFGSCRHLGFRIRMQERSRVPFRVPTILIEFVLDLFFQGFSNISKAKKSPDLSFQTESECKLSLYIQTTLSSRLLSYI